MSSTTMHKGPHHNPLMVGYTCFLLVVSYTRLDIATPSLLGNLIFIPNHHFKITLWVDIIFVLFFHSNINKIMYTSKWIKTIRILPLKCPWYFIVYNDKKLDRALQEILGISSTSFSSSFNMSSTISSNVSSINSTKISVSKTYNFWVVHWWSSPNFSS